MNCLNQHVLPFEIDGVGYAINGGSCHKASVQAGYDVVLGLDYGMPRFHNDPWPRMAVPATEIARYLIEDFSVPLEVESFTQMLDWLHERVVSGKRVFVGCTAGHGRTGLVLACYLGRHTDIAQPISYVRLNYCNHAVETAEQEAWIRKHFIRPPKEGWYKQFCDALLGRGELL